jgi:hypothetical protein
LRIVFKVLASLVGLLIGEIILGYILSIPQVVNIIIKIQTLSESLMPIPFRLIIIISTATIAGFFIVRMVLNERKILQELRDTLYDNLETLENYKRINEQYPSQVSDEDVERIKLKIKRIHQEIKSRELSIPVNDSDMNKK